MKNDTTKVDAKANDKAKAKMKKKLEAEKLKKQKLREAKKAKRAKALEKRKAKIEANKKRRAEKKAKKLALIEKKRAKKLALKAKKQELRQKKLEKIAKQKAKAKELKLKAREKTKAQKAKLKELKSKETPDKAKDTISITVKLLKDYVKSLAKDAAGIDDKKVKKLQALGFVFNDDSVSFTFEASKNAKKPRKEKVDKTPPKVDEPEVVIDEKALDTVIDNVIKDDAKAIEALSEELENDEDRSREVPVGDTYADNVDTSSVDDAKDEFEDNEDDDTIDDLRDEPDDDKVAFRRDWNSEFGDDGERNEDW